VKNKTQKILISACLLGENVKYDSTNNDIRNNKLIKKLLKEDMLIPICPETLGGLPTPRVPAELINQKAIDKDGYDKTEEFKVGAKKALHVALLYDVKIAIMKSRSPSCGSELIYDGTFSKNLIKGDGLAVKILKENGIQVFTEHDLDTLKSVLVYI